MSDGRQVGVHVSGNPSDRPVVLFHGMPGSRVGPVPSDQVLQDLGVFLVTFDRPGYGLSERLPGRRVADVAGDVREIADTLGLDEFAVLGRSGGAPHALACAALLPQRVSRAAALVSFAPCDAIGLDWFAGMVDSNVEDFKDAVTDPGSVAARLERKAAEIRADPFSMVISLDAVMPESDRRVVAEPGLRRMLAATFAEAVRASADGWIDDNTALCVPWGFAVSDIRVPVLLWHGAEDIYSPAVHTRWLGDNISTATATIQPDAGHFGVYEVLPRVLAWLTRPGR
jgi:pimeloyl-ACP methyl ester carboxylesterase